MSNLEKTFWGDMEKKELVQQIQEKTDAILEEIKAVIGTSGSRTSRETLAAMSNLEKTFWGDMEPIIKGESGPIRARLNQEVDRRVKAAVARVDKDGDRSLSKNEIKKLLKNQVTMQFFEMCLDLDREFE